MQLFDLREPVNAWSHGTGMMLALLVTWILWKRCATLHGCRQLGLRAWHSSTRYQRNKAIGSVVFGLSLILCYAVSAAFHAVRIHGDRLNWLQRLDHVGIYLLIAGTYTPVALALMRRIWAWGTLTTVWTAALVCAGRVWCGGVLPMSVSTVVYLTMGWGALLCYCEMVRGYSHKALAPLPAGGVLYSIGAIINLARWPVVLPGFFGSHELFHFFVMAGSTCHIYFMLRVVIPATEPISLPLKQVPQLTPMPLFQRFAVWKPHFVLTARSVGNTMAATGGAVDRHDQLDFPPPIAQV
jgi:hemolysin III